MNSRHLQNLTLVATLLWAAGSLGQGFKLVDEDGRKIYVNDESQPKFNPVPVGEPRKAPASGELVYWSNSQRRWKTVPRPRTAAFRAAKSAAAEVSDFVAKSDLYASDRSEGESDKRLAKAATIEAAIDQAAARHNVDPNLVRALIKVESNFNPRAVSRKGAMGLMQLMPGTARTLNVANPFDPSENVDAGVRHLKQLLESFGGDLHLSLAAYNAGSNAVRRNKGIPPYRETQNYVRQITHLYWNGESGQLSGGPIRNPIRVWRDEDGHFVFSNID
ncbi:MAG: lytic transglycosylase domain-containing protein [Acidobacteriales bacterium]|nr:lytic transglycosylase domain-containing protein [Terriglobales bacterium]